MKRVAFYTLGCKVNVYETEGMKRLFARSGYDIVDFAEKADIYIINTCTVTHLSDRKSRQIIRRAKVNNPESIVAAVGCYAQVSPEDVANIDGVNLILGNKNKSNIVNYIEGISYGQQKVVVEKEKDLKEYEELWADTYSGKTRAFLKIQEGCNQFCSYCIIPHARGRIKSRDYYNIFEESRRLALNGFKEIVLTGIHLTSYGVDKKKYSLLDVISEMHKIPGIERIRLGSLEPMYITDAFIDRLPEFNLLCPHFHLSLQSGCDSTLRRMNRKYTVGEYRGIVSKLRMAVKDVAITTDIMTGFPGETMEEFEETYEFVEEMVFSQAHIFKFSPRKGTPASEYVDQVEPGVKEERSKRLISLTNKHKKLYRSGFVGRRMPVLFEQENSGEKGFIEGLTSNYIPVLCKGEYSVQGEIKEVTMDRVGDEHVFGTIIA